MNDATPVANHKRTGGALLVDSLLAYGVPLWTCVPGESFLAVLDALYDRQNPDQRHAQTVELIVTRHEAAAANMAEAAGKLSGRAAVCMVTRGPGATHASIGLHTAYQDGTPMVLVVGQVARGNLGRQAFQEMDYNHVFGSSAKSIVTVMSADRIPEHVAHAMTVAHCGRPGPVVLVVPEDVLTEETHSPVRRPQLRQSPSLATSDLDHILDELEQSERPLVIVGGPGWTSAVGRELIEFSRRSEVPVAAAFRWQDAVDNCDPSYVGYLGLGCSPSLRTAAAEADLVVAFGPRLDDPTTDGYALTERATRLLQLTEDPTELGLGPLAHTQVVCSLASAATALSGRLLSASPLRGKWLAELRADYERFRTPPQPAPTPDLAAAIVHLRNMLPDDAVVTTGAGNYTVWVQRFFEFRRYGTQLAPRNGAMGYGLPAALAAAALDRSRRVVAFAGDGCLLMSGSELATAVQFGLRVIVIVANNSMFGTIRMHQERAYPGRQIATELRNPDFVAYAESFGAGAALVENDADFPAALDRALSHDGPFLIELRTDQLQLTPNVRLG